MEKLSTIDLTRSRAALGAQKSTPTVFLTHNIKLHNPETRLQMKTLALIAKTFTKPTHHPLHKYVNQATAEKVLSPHKPSNRFFQSPPFNDFNDFTHQQTINPNVQLRRPPNYAMLIINGEKKAAKDLKHSSSHLMVYTEGQHPPKEYTVAAAWCSNANEAFSETLGQ